MKYFITTNEDGWVITISEREDSSPVTPAILTETELSEIPVLVRPDPHSQLKLVGLELVWVDPRTFTEIKAAKREQINAWWLTANRKGFTFGGKLIRMADELDQWNINGTNGTVALTGGFPPGWKGFWKASDNTYVAIPDVATWKDFYSAMAAQGAANFGTSQALKAQLDAAQTVAEVEAVVWPASLD